MMDKLFLEMLREKMDSKLPGWNAQKLLAPRQREEEIERAQMKLSSARKSAVLILLYKKGGEIYLPLIKRAVYDGVHSGQISLPGGKVEKSDLSYEFTARREAEEEIGINANKVIILKQLTDLFIPPSNFLVKTFVGYLPYKPQFVIDTKEVQKIIEIPISAFLKTGVIKEKVFISSSTGDKTKAPYFEVENLEIWGATAMIINELLEIIRQQ